MCATCGCGRQKDKHGMKTLASANKKYDKKDDKAQDAKVMKNMTPAQMVEFKKKDKKMDKKKPSAKADLKMDKALAKKIKKK